MGSQFYRPDKEDYNEDDKVIRNDGYMHIKNKKRLCKISVGGKVNE